MFLIYNLFYMGKNYDYLLKLLNSGKGSFQKKFYELLGSMLERLPLYNILTHYLKVSKRDYLLPFIGGLANIGRPTNVIFPPELIEQALSLILSGLNNTLAIQSNLHWVWPYWVEKQQDPDALEFIPTGVNVITGNLTLRNWTSLSIFNSKNECMVDPVGMLTLFPFSWSIIPYIFINEQRYIPPKISNHVRQELFNGSLPRVITHYDVVQYLRWISEIEVFETLGEELAVQVNTLENMSDEVMTLVFGISIRPYNPLTIGHINNLKFKNNLWRVNGKPGILLLDPPDHTGTSYRFLGDPIITRKKRQNKNHRKSKSGIIGGIAEYEIRLLPKEKKVIHIIGVIGKRTTVPNRKFKHITLDEINNARKINMNEWYDWERRGLTLSIPDKRLEAAFYAVKNHLPVFDDKDYFTAGTFFYHTCWIRDGSFIALAYENLGLCEYVIPKIYFLMKLQGSDGSFKSQNGEWDSTGQVIFTALNCIRHKGCDDLLIDFYPMLLRGARWIETKRMSTKLSPSPHFGLLPAGISAEHFGPNDHYFWDNFWSLAGLKCLKWAALRLNKKSDLEWLAEVYEDYREDINGVIAYAIENGGKGEMLPCSPYRLMDSASVGNLIAVTPLDIYTEEEKWLLPTLDFLWEHNIRDGLFYQKIIHTGLNVYLSLQFAKTLLYIDDKRWQEMLDAILRYASPTYTWPEAIHPRTKGGCMGDGDHGWAASEFINFVRDMFIVEKGGEILLGLGIYDQWYKDGLRIEIDNASTLYGVVSYALSLEADELSISWRIKHNSTHSNAPMFLVLSKDLFAEGSQTLLKGLHFGSNKIKVLLINDAGVYKFKIKESKNALDTRI